MTDTNAQNAGSVADRFQYLTERHYRANRLLGEVAHNSTEAQEAALTLLVTAVELGRMGCTQDADGRWHMPDDATDSETK